MIFKGFEYIVTEKEKEAIESNPTVAGGSVFYPLQNDVADVVLPEMDEAKNNQKKANKTA
ncbi:MAG: hypothetical protein U5L45_00250 [Saprospiraceae bacterium]|nr:hypothetical protein [Saprospiraceae bacterium]